MIYINILYTYVIYSIYEWIAAAVTHCQPMEAEPDDINIWITRNIIIIN